MGWPRRPCGCGGVARVSVAVVMAASIGVGPRHDIDGRLATGLAPASERVRGPASRMREWANGHGHLRGRSDAR
jgi:hypothetical protein